MGRIIKMDFSGVSTLKLKEIHHGYESKIELLKRELDDMQRKNSIIEEELHKRYRLDELRRKIEEDSKDKIEKILSETKTAKKKADPKKKEEEESVDSRKEQEKKWTIDEMKKLLDKKGVKYSASLKKAEFVALIREHNGVREMNALHKEK